jgi:hypothetical protein
MALLVVLTTSLVMVSTVQAQRPHREGREKMERVGKKGRGEHHWAKPLTEEQVAELEKYLKEIDPARLEKLEELKEKRPEMYEKVAAKGYWGMKRLEKLKEKNPAAYKQKMEYFKLEGEMRSLAGDYRKSKSDSEKAKIKKQLKPKLDRLFDLRQEGRKYEIKNLQKKAADLEKSLAERKSNKNKIIEKHLEKILGEKDDLEW